MSIWNMEAAGAKLSEVVRQARDEGPQTITVGGEQAAVVVSPETYERLTGPPPGQTWVDRLRESFIGDIDI